MPTQLACLRDTSCYTAQLLDISDNNSYVNFSTYLPEEEWIHSGKRKSAALMLTGI